MCFPPRRAHLNDRQTTFGTLHGALFRLGKVLLPLGLPFAQESVCHEDKARGGEYDHKGHWRHTDVVCN